MSDQDYLNPEFHKYLWMAFGVIAILGFSPYKPKESRKFKNKII